MFTGRFERLLDEKGRIVLPPPYRKALPDDCFLAKPLDKACVQIIPEESMDKVAERVEAAMRAGDLSGASYTVWASTVTPGRTDSQGRLAIPQDLRDRAGLEREVVLVGSISRVEIWSPGAWAELEQRADADAVDMSRWI